MSEIFICDDDALISWYEHMLEAIKAQYPHLKEEVVKPVILDAANGAIDSEEFKKAIKELAKNE